MNKLYRKCVYLLVKSLFLFARLSLAVGDVWIKATVMFYLPGKVAKKVGYFFYPLASVNNSSASVKTT